MKNDPSKVDPLKDAFEELNLDDKAAFLVRAAFSTASTAVDEIGAKISDLIDTIAEKQANAEDTGENVQSEESDPPEPEGKTE